MSQVLFDARGLEEFYGIKSDRSNRVSSFLQKGVHGFVIHSRCFLSVAFNT